LPTSTHDAAAGPQARIERAVDAAYATGIKPFEFGGRDGTAASDQGRAASFVNCPTGCKSLISLHISWANSGQKPF
jgi:hypothetical protein